jgi:outer membrane protein assembly factor BamB
LLEAAVAMDSTLYVRDPKTVSALDPAGAVRWAEKLQNPAPSSELAPPTTLADSRMAIAATAKMVVVYERTGKVSWSFSPPSEELLVAPPTGMQTEGLVLLTTRATYYLSAAGDVRFRTPSADRTAEL